MLRATYGSLVWLCALAPLYVVSFPTPEQFSVSIVDKSRGQLVNATVCLPQPFSSKLPLLVFAHGWRVAAEDYEYLCSQLASDQGHQWAVALVQTPLEDPAVNPPPLEPLAQDSAFLSTALLSFPKLAAKLTGQVVLGGHSMGGGTSVMAASPPYSATLDAMSLWAPGLYGKNPANASNVEVPTLILVGSDDCVNVPDMPLRGVDVYQKVASLQKALVVLKDANHCFWSTPVKGSCSFDICTGVPRLQQQATGMRIFQQFASAVLKQGIVATDDTRWAAFEQFLGTGRDPQTGVEWQGVATANGSSVVDPFKWPLCPPKCCSAALDRKSVV